MGEEGQEQPGYLQCLHKRKTVKELIMMKRIGSQSEHTNHTDKDWTCQKNMWQQMFKPVKPDLACEAINSEPSPDAFSTHISPGLANHFLPSPKIGFVTEQQIRQSVPQRHQAPTVNGKMTLFHWQIYKEAKRLQGVTTETLNTQDEDGDTVLHIAVAQGRRALTYVLARKMVSAGLLDVKEHNGQTALQIAVATNQHLITQDLLVHGALINTRDCWGRSPLHVCAEKGYFLTLQNIQRSLMKNWQPIDVEMFNYDGLTPLHMAVLSHNAVVKELRCQASPCSAIATELSQRRQMYMVCIRTLLLMGASSGTKDLKSGRTSLHMAAEEANVELFQFVLDQPSTQSLVNVKTFSGNTALHIVSALQNNKAQVGAVRLLMRLGADPSTKNLENDLPVQLVPGGPIGDKVRRILKGKDK
ncbi:NF-kappa-B inhibitor zeta isoform 2-T2 [Polymixia lowei]